MGEHIAVAYRSCRKLPRQQVSVQRLDLAGEVEMLCEGILLWLAGLDAAVFGTLPGTPANESLGRHFWTIVDPNAFRATTEIGQALQARIGRAQGIKAPHSMVRHSLLASSITLSDRHLRSL